MQGEEYAFKQIIKTGSGEDLLGAFYHFVDISKSPKSPTLRDNLSLDIDLANEVQRIQQDIYSSGQTNYQLSKVQSLLKKWRNKSKKSNGLIDNSSDLPSVNPN